MKGWHSVLLLAMATLVISLACGEETSQGIPTETPQTDAPMASAIANTPVSATPAASTPPLAPTPATAQPTLPAISTEVPTPTSAPSPTFPAAAGSGALFVLGSHSATAPPGFGPGSAGGFNLSPLPHATPVEGSLTVSVIGSVTVVPDEAHVMVFPEMDYGISGPEQLSTEDRRDIVANLVAMGVSEAAIDFEHLGRYEPTSITVEVNVDEYADTGESIVAAIEKVVRRSESSGVRFSLSEGNCERAISLARREAVPEAEAAADDLAEALDLGRGEVIGALEYPLQRLTYGLPGTDVGGCAGLNAGAYSPLLPFDSEAEVEVSVGLQVSYGIR